jgi:hypothetical protein
MIYAVDVLPVPSAVPMLANAPVAGGKAASAASESAAAAIDDASVICAPEKDIVIGPWVA